MTLRRIIILGVLVGMSSGCDGRYSSGDRVLVSKCSYDTGISPPKRYDVVVFKYPGNGPGEGPVEKGTPKNYIKRLLGLPGELIAIFFGRLYHRVPEEGKGPFFDDLKDGAIHPNDLWKPANMHATNDERGFNLHGNGPDADEEGLLARTWFNEGKYTILRKPPKVMLALRRIVYDNDYQPKDLKERKEPAKFDRWNPAAGSAWKTDKTTGFITEAKAGEQIDWLRYRHLTRPDGALAGGFELDKMLILDTLDYNMLQTDGELGDMNASIYAHAHWVGDLMLECNVEVKDAKGEFWLDLNKGIDHFRACFDLASGQCTLYREGPDKKQVKLDAKPTRLKGPGNYLVRFANIDARLTVWVDRELPFGDGAEYDPPEVRAPNETISDKALIERRGPTAGDLDPAGLGVKGAAVAVTHLRLWRDTYYRTRISNNNDTDYDQNIGMARNDWCNPASFSKLREQRYTTMYVQPGHYLCLGDNSQSSSDSRVWGLVPERLMLGRALLVYFPLERMGPIR